MKKLLLGLTGIFVINWLSVTLLLLTLAILAYIPALQFSKIKVPEVSDYIIGFFDLSILPATAFASILTIVAALITLKAIQLHQRLSLSDLWKVLRSFLVFTLILASIFHLLLALNLAGMIQHELAIVYVVYFHTWILPVFWILLGTYWVNRYFQLFSNNAEWT